MAYDIALDDTGDLLLVQNPAGNWDITLIDGVQRVKQAIRIVLQTWLAEWIFDITIGVPYLQNILVKNPQLPSVESLLSAQILAVDDVLAVTSISLALDPISRILTVTYFATSDMGLITDVLALMQPGSVTS